jgi:tetratricopeptide (TPR) repeat protein
MPWLEVLAAGGDERQAAILARVLPQANATPAEALEGPAEKARWLATVEALAARFTGAVWILDGADRLDPVSHELVSHLLVRGAERGWRWLVALEDPEAFGMALSPRYLNDGAPAEDGFDAMGPAARELAMVAAILGPAPSLEILEALRGGDEAVFLDALHELETANVAGFVDGRMVFRHPARVPSLVAAWAPAADVAVRMAAANWLGERVYTLADALAVARWHVGGETPEAGVELAIAAARRCLELQVPADDVLTGYEGMAGLTTTQALELAGLRAWSHRLNGRVAAALSIYEQEILPVARTAEALLAYGQLHQQAGELTRALTTFAEAIKLADEGGDAVTGVRARLAVGRVASLAGQTGVALTHLGAAARRAREHGLTPLMAAAAGYRGYLLATTRPERLEDGVALLTEAIALHLEGGDPHAMAETLDHLGHVLLAAGRMPEARRSFTAYLDLCERMGTGPQALFAGLDLAAVLWEQGDLTGCLAAARQAGELATRQGLAFAQGRALVLEGLARLHQGELSAGHARLEQGLAVARGSDNRFLELGLVVHQVEALLFLGRLDEAASALGRANELARAAHDGSYAQKLRRLAAWRAFRAGEPDAAERAAALVEAARAHGPLETAHALVLLARVGDRDALAEARVLTAAQGLDGLVADLAWLEGSWLDGEEARGVYQAGREVAEAHGLRLAALLCRAGLGESERELAAGELVAMVESLNEPGREAFMAFPERRGVFARSAAAITALLHAAACEALAADEPLVVLQERLRELAGARRVTLLVGPELKAISGEDVDLGLARRVQQQGRVLVDSIEDAGHGALALGLRMVTAVPLLHAGEVRGVAYLDAGEPQALMRMGELLGAVLAR